MQLLAPRYSTFTSVIPLRARTAQFQGDRHHVVVVKVERGRLIAPGRLGFSSMEIAARHVIPPRPVTFRSLTL